MPYVKKKKKKKKEKSLIVPCISQINNAGERGVHLELKTCI